VLPTASGAAGTALLQRKKEGVRLYVIKIENQLPMGPAYLGSILSTEDLDREELGPISKLAKQLFAAGKRKFSDLNLWLYGQERATAKRYTFDDAVSARNEWLVGHPKRRSDIFILEALETMVV
jgi:hypothetical protein